MNKKVFGYLSEFVVMIRYLFLFYFPLKHRWLWHKNGEIDLILKRFNTIVFVEVKGRKNHELVTLSERQALRIKKTIKLFLLTFDKYNKHNIRLDFAYVNRFFMLKVVENAWHY